MTREQLINKVIAAVPLNDISIAKDAVDEYSEQECLLFAKFCMDKTLQDCNTDDKWTLDDFSEVTDKNIYQLYKNKDNANNNS